MTQSAAEAMRRWRAANPEKREQERAAHRARGRALSRLAELHAAEFARLQDEERAAEDLPPVGTPFVAGGVKYRSVS